MAKVIIDPSACKGCELCVSVCPRKILVLSSSSRNKKGYHTAEVTDMSRCTGCTACAVMCPDCAISVER